MEFQLGPCHAWSNPAGMSHAAKVLALSCYVAFIAIAFTYSWS
jgi:hypothetical protein